MEILLKTGRIFYGICIAGIGMQQFYYSDLRPVILPPQWPAWIHGLPVLAYITGAAFVISGFMIIAGKKLKTVSLLLGGFLFAMSISFHPAYLLFKGPYSPRHLALWTDALKELALSGGAFVIAGSRGEGKLNGEKETQLIRVLKKLIPPGSVLFSIMMIAFGCDHFIYTEGVSKLVPGWIPDPVFWTYFAGIALITSGVGIISKIKLRLVALLTATMLFLWVILLHIPRAVASPGIDNGNEITSVFEALAFSGIALEIACNKKKEIQAS